MGNFSIKLAKRYVFSGKNAIEVNVISWIAFLALGFVTACLVVILSVFAGLEELNLQFYSNINPDLKILPYQGKSFLVDKDLIKSLEDFKASGEIDVYSSVIEEKSYISYDKKNHIVSIKGVDDQFNQIYRLDTMVKIGNPLSSEYPDEVILGSGVSSKLSLYIDPNEPVELFVPKPGTGIINDIDDAFNQVEVYSTGIFFINDKYEQFVFSNLKLTQRLLNYKSNQVSAIEIKSNNTNTENVKKVIQNAIGNRYIVKTRQQLDAAFLKMMNTENLIIYLIFILILIIASFNLAGSVAIIIIDKRKEAKTLKSLGMADAQLKYTHFITGMLITIYALIFGLLMGTGVAWLQQTLGLVVISPTVPFPVKFTFWNFGIIIVSVLFIGAIVSWFVSYNVKFKKSDEFT